MLGLDTNILLRYVLQDHREQAELATRIIEEDCTPETPGYINQLVLCEFVWSLRRGYGYSPGDIQELLENILEVDRLLIEDESDVALALAEAKGGTGIADSLIARRNVSAGCSRTLTFDRKAARLSAMELPGAKE